VPPRRLFLSRIERDFDPARDIAAGPWCFVDNEDEFEGWDDLPFTDAFADSRELVRADALTRRLANHIALTWADRMNSQTGRSYSATLWRNFLILWIVAATQISWRCYRNMELLIERHGADPLHVRVLKGDPDWQIDSISEFMRLLTLDGYFTFWMQSLMLRHMAPGSWKLEPVLQETSGAPGMPEWPVDAPVVERRNPLSAFIGRLGFDHVQGTKWVRPFFGVLINLLPRRAATGKKFVPDEDVLKEFPAVFLAVLGDFLEATLPLNFSDGLTDILNDVERLKFYPGRLTITHAASLDVRNQLINVLSVEHGERVVGFQHGGWYGTAGAESWASESEYIYHAFITWGWTEQADFYGNMMPLPAPVLSSIRNAHKVRNDKLIFVGTRMIVQNDRLDTRPSSVRWLTYRKIKRDFINALGGSPREALAYRPYHRAKPPLQDGVYMTRHFPDLPILEGPLHSAFLQCRLVVLDHPGTTLNFVMAANVPTVCYWDPKDWPLCRQAEVQFERLREAGILFDTPEEAAIHVNAIWGDVPGWWNSHDIVSARRQWLEQYAQTSPIWWWHWAVGIWKLASGSSLHLQETKP